jgi:hypothetical protein
MSKLAWAIGVVSAALLASPAAMAGGGPGNAGTQTVVAQAADPAPAAAPDGMSDAEKQSLGCAIVGGGTMVATYIAGPTEAILLLGGGLLTPSSNTILAMSLVGSIGAASCAIGSVATPFALWFYDQSDAIANRLLQVSAEAGRSAVTAVGALGDELLRGLVPGNSAPRSQLADRPALLR